jgi:hypothetical protein
MELQGAQQTTGGASAKVLGLNYFLRLFKPFFMISSRTAKVATVLGSIPYPPKQWILRGGRQSSVK